MKRLHTVHSNRNSQLAVAMLCLRAGRPITMLKARRYWPTLLVNLLSLLVLSAPMQAYAVPPGTSISNTAAANFSISGTPVSRNSNTVNTITVGGSTPATIELLQYNSTGAGSNYNTSPTSCRSGSATGALNPSGNPSHFNPSFDLTVQPLNLSPAYSFHQGEPVFIKVEDADQNLDALVRDVVEVTVTSTPGGDVERVQLSETDINTGVFVGFAQSTMTAAVNYNCVLTIAENSRIDADYVDPNDVTDTATTNELVDPFGLVIDSITGAVIDGAIITLLNAGGGVAAVFGDNGVDSYPSTITSGGTATDTSGQAYNFPSGGYRFPYVAPGNYILQITPPTNFAGPSIRTPVQIQAIPGAPYAIHPQASYGVAFTINAGPPLNVDIPLDALNTELFVQKSSNRGQAAVGDFVKYQISMANTSATVTAANVVLTDVLPLGFRYQSGSLRLNGAVAADPGVSSDARTLSITLGNVPLSTTVDVEYVVQLGANTNLGRAMNVVQASSDNTPDSNVDSASLSVIDDLFRNKTQIIGRVVSQCPGDADEPLPGVAGVRLVMEDGRQVLTDNEGLYHFASVAAGTHVIQLDEKSIPSNMEIAQCYDNTRFAGTPHSRFVDVQGGSLWRADFYLKARAPKQGNIGLRLTSSLDQDLVNYRLHINGDSFGYDNRRITFMLPDGVEYLAASAKLDDVAVDDPVQAYGSLTFRLGDESTDHWQQQLNFQARITDQSKSEYISKALITFDTQDQRNQRTPLAENKIGPAEAELAVATYKFHPRFAPMQSELSEAERLRLDESLVMLKEKVIKQIQGVGHTDSNPVSEVTREAILDNYVLARLRAQNVGSYVQQHLKLDESKLILSAKGADQPLMPNKTHYGRKMNRRVDLKVEALEEKISDQLAVQISDSGQQNAVVSQALQADLILLPTLPAAQMPALNLAVDSAEWEELDASFAWVYPSVAQRPSIPSTRIAIKHAPGQKVVLVLNGEPVPAVNFERQQSSPQRNVVVSVWAGVDLIEGANNFVAKLLAGDGSEISRIEHSVHYAGRPYNAQYVAEYSQIVADGKTPILIAVKLFDRWGEPVPAGLTGGYSVAAPYAAKSQLSELQQNLLHPLEAAVAKFQVQGEGLTHIELVPSLEIGKVKLSLPLATGKTQDIEVWLKPEQRDWILVGLAEGTAGYKTIKDNMQTAEAAGHEEDGYFDGRVALYAKGQISGEYLLTLAYDTAKKDPERMGNGLLGIDPQQQYTLYADRSEQSFDARSSEKLYLRIERQQFYAMFGDFDTGLTVTELSRYSRSLTGVKTEFENENFNLNAFVADTDKHFVRDEIRGDGTSGLYRLSRSDIMMNSDRVAIETRDRFHSERVLQRHELRRYLDYNIDPIDGTIYFKQPIYSQDSSFNPIYIVAEYEVLGSVGEDRQAGGRAAIKLLDGNLEVGVTAISENAEGVTGELSGLDISLQISDATSLNLEAAQTDVATNSGSAQLIELKHSGEQLEARVYTREQEAGFGLGQQAGSETATRKSGVEARYHLTESLDILADVYKEEVTSTGAERDVAAIGGEYKQDLYSLAVGVRFAEDVDGAANETRAEMLTLGARRELFNRAISLRANAELAVEENTHQDYPERLIVGADYRINSVITLFAEQELTENDKTETSSSRLGFRSQPWKLASINSSIEEQVNENGLRTFANLGLTQAVILNENWRLDFGVDRSETISSTPVVPFNVNVPPASGTLNNDFTAVSVAAIYQQELWGLTTRFEDRDADLDDKQGLFFGFYRQQTPGLGFSLSAQLYNTEYVSGDQDKDTNVRFSLAYRPLGSSWSILERLDYEYDLATNSGISNTSRKWVNNLSTNYQPNTRNQLALSYGVKRVEDDFDGDSYTGMTHFLGAEYRYDLSDNWDIGVQAALLQSEQDVYSAGLSTGFNLGDNWWLSLGYNVAGFNDNDFSEAGYTAHGPYMKLRLGFDQHSAERFVNWWQRDQNSETQ